MTRFEIVDDAKQAWRWLSMQAMTAALAVQGAWVVLPDDMRATVPPDYVQWLTFALLGLGIVGRLVKQEPK
jgi:protein-S-isoprenylcysteine O-methyltransferase Ste14